MCGIAGFIGKKKDLPSKKKLKNCKNLMEIRGPDGFNFKTIENKYHSSLILHSRLAIIDPKYRSSQPMEDNDGILAFNGMIYNYLELKKKLSKRKIKFLTKSDTEVLLKILNLYGIDGLNIIEGMWSFFYYNKKNKKIILSRDFFGEKPLYYTINKKNIIFGSNINYIKELSYSKFDLDDEMVNKSLNFGYKTFYSNSKTLFKNIKCLMPGQSLIIDKNKIINIKNNSTSNIKINNVNYSNTKRKIKSNLIENFKKVVRSDFPVACLLSGGIDSNLVASFAKKFVNNKFECFSIKNNDKFYNENNQINKAIKKLSIKHNFINYDKKKSLKNLKDIIKKTSSVVPSATWLLYGQILKKIKNKGFKVVLGGAGGDEFFAGYYIHHLFYLKSIKNKKKFEDYYKVWSKNIKPLIRSKFLNDYKFFLRNSSITNSNLTPFLENKIFIRKKLNYKIRYKNFLKDELKNFLFHEIFYSSLPAQLNPADNISMYYGIEHRSPILNQNLLKLTLSSQNEYLLKDGYGKFILRDILSEFSHKDIAWSKNKIGFYSDFKNIFDVKDKVFRRELFKSKRINKFLNKERIIKLLNSKKRLSNSQSHFIFSVLNLSILDNCYGT